MDLKFSIFQQIYLVSRKLEKIKVDLMGNSRIGIRRERMKSVH